MSSYRVQVSTPSFEQSLTVQTKEKRRRSTMFVSCSCTFYIFIVHLTTHYTARNTESREEGRLVKTELENNFEETFVAIPELLRTD